ncbi:hypothetical protein J2W42_000725 [Rhizobium tibeticum]|nr:hypothetical protein [Rhizobium tibeticum]
MGEAHLRFIELAATLATSCSGGHKIKQRMRSRIKSRSNSASVAKMPNTMRPDAVVMSICAPSPAMTLRPIPRSDKSFPVLIR